MPPNGSAIFAGKVIIAADKEDSDNEPLEAKDELTSFKKAEDNKKFQAQIKKLKIVKGVGEQCP